MWQACLTYDVESHLREAAGRSKSWGCRYLRIETDYSPSDTARIAVRVEALLETVGQRPCPSIDTLPMTTVAYCHPLVPPEWIAAHGLAGRSWLPLAADRRVRPTRPRRRAARALSPPEGRRTRLRKKHDPQQAESVLG